jgi:hypothetical protein
MDSKTKGAKETGVARGTRGVDNPAPCSTSGLDIQGQMRIGDRISIGVRGEGLVLTQSHSGREVEVSEAALAGLLDEEYFVDHKGVDAKPGRR